MPARDINQIDEINKRIPKKYLKVSIHFPGLGKNETICGNIKKIRYGSAKPTETLKKITKIRLLDASIENPTAVPKNGALQGVARSVAKTPDKKCPNRLFAVE